MYYESSVMKLFIMAVSELARRMYYGELEPWPITKLGDDYESVLTEAAKSMASRYPDLFKNSDDVLFAFRPSTDDLILFMNTIANGREPEKGKFAFVVKEMVRVKSGDEQYAQSPMITFPNGDLYKLFRHFLIMIHEAIENTHRLPAFYAHICSTIESKSNIFMKVTLPELKQGADGASQKTRNAQAVDESADENKYAPSLRHVIPFYKLFNPYTPDIQEHYAKRFFRGRDPMWQDVITGYGIKRAVWQRRTVELIEKFTRNLVILTSGKPCSGKSTEIKRVAFKLAMTGRYAVYEFKSISHNATTLINELNDVYKKTKEKQRVLFLIDDASFTLDLWLAVIRDYGNKRPSIWILCDNTDNWESTVGTDIEKIIAAELTDSDVRHIALSELNNSEIKRLLANFKAWNLDIGIKSLLVTTNQFHEQCSGMLAGASIAVTEGMAAYRKRLVEEADNFQALFHCHATGDKPYGKLYKAVCALHAIGVKPTYRWVTEWLKLNGLQGEKAIRVVMNEILSRELIVASDNFRLKGRHESISRIIVEETCSAEELCELYESWIRSVTPRNADQVIEVLRMLIHPVCRKHLILLPQYRNIYLAIRDMIPMSIFQYFMCYYGKDTEHMTSFWHDMKDRELTKCLSSGPGPASVPDQIIDETLLHAYALFHAGTPHAAKAEIILCEAISRDKTNAMLWETLVILYHESGFRRAAVSCGRDALRAASINPMLIRRVASYMWMMKYYDEALRNLRGTLDVFFKGEIPVGGKLYEWASLVETLAMYTSSAGLSKEALGIIKEAGEHDVTSEELSHLEIKIIKGDVQEVNMLEGKKLAHDWIGEIRVPNRDNIIFIHPVWGKRWVYTLKDKNLNMSAGGFRHGDELIFDLWQRSDEKAMAINVERHEWGWQGLEAPFIGSVKIMPAVKRLNIAMCI